MRGAGLDIGSRTIDLAVLEDGRLVSWQIADTTHDPAGVCSKLLAQERFEKVAATGYGRGLAELEFDCPTLTEIKAYAIGARHLFPNCRTILDIGCANGYLLESLVKWTSDRGLAVTPYGIESSEKLIAVARERLPQYKDSAG